MKTSSKTKSLLIGLLVLVIGTVVMASGSHQQLLKSYAIGNSSKAVTSKAVTSKDSVQPPLAQSVNQQPAIPAHIVYGLLFREIRNFNKKADEFSNRGTKMDALRDYQGKKAGLNDNQSFMLKRIAISTDLEIVKLDQHARSITETARKQHDYGQLKPGEALPQIPEELKTLDRQRVSLILSGREKLRQALGDKEFDRFDKFINKEIADKAKPVELKPHKKRF